MLWHQKRVGLVEKGGRRHQNGWTWVRIAVSGTKTGVGSKMGASRSKMGVGGLKTDVGESKRVSMVLRCRNRVGGRCNWDGRSIKCAYN